MDADLRPLEELAARLRELDAAGVAIATEAAPEVEKAARATAAAGTSAEGDAWKPRKDGGRPLANAAKAITVVVSGATNAVITLVLKGHDVFHHFGTKHVPARPILPTKGDVPAPIADAIRAAAARVVKRTLGGRS